MLKPGPIFIAFCMAAIAVSLGVILTVGLGLSLPVATGGGLVAVLIVAALTKFLAGAGANRSAPSRLFEIEERLGTLAERINVAEQRFTRLESALPESTRRTTAPLEREIGELGTLVRALAEQIERHDSALADMPVRHAMHEEFATAISAPVAHAEPPRTTPPRSEPGIAQSSLSMPQAGAFRSFDPGSGKRIRRAIESDGIELHLQPVVSLPQRRVTHYDTQPFLRDDDGVLVPPSDFVVDARAAGLLPALDAFVLERSLRVARRLKARERDLSLIVNLNGETLIGDGFANEIARRLDANTDLATHLMLGFSQDALHAFGALEAEMLASLAERGFRFALTGVTELALEARALNAFGVRLVRISADVLLDPSGILDTPIHPADLPGLLRRHQILLVADGVESEARVADLLDMDARGAQGPVFGIPRPVRPEIFAEAEPQKGSASFGSPPKPPVQPLHSVVRRA